MEGSVVMSGGRTKTGDGHLEVYRELGQDALQYHAKDNQKTTSQTSNLHYPR